MTRPIPNCPPKPENASSFTGYEKLECSIQVVTPLFGGGVEAGEPDPVTLDVENMRTKSKQMGL